jgi:hypothetical protein
LLQLDRLKNLHLEGTKISIDGLKALDRGKSLREVVINKGQFPDEQLSELRQQLTKIKVEEEGRLTY